MEAMDHAPSPDYATFTGAQLLRWTDRSNGRSVGISPLKRAAAGVPRPGTMTRLSQEGQLRHGIV